MTAPEYSTIIDIGSTPTNDRILYSLAYRLEHRLSSLPSRNWYRWLDIGCNAGALLQLVSCGFGVDSSSSLVRLAKSRRCDVARAEATKLPFAGRRFEIAVLSCVLEQLEEPEYALLEAVRVADYVMGISPRPGKSPWGSVGTWVKSVLSAQWFEARGCRVEIFDEQRFFFESVWR